MSRVSLWILCLHLAFTIPVVGHALLHKRDPRSALGWILMVVGYPFLGAFLYAIFAVNRVRPQLERHGRISAFAARPAQLEDIDRERRRIGDLCEDDGITRLLSIGQSVSPHALRAGNSVELLINGDEAYPEMLRAIEEATDRVWLAVYIFERNELGMRFVDALERAHKRGVDVRVLLDGMGDIISRSFMHRILRRRRIRVLSFLPPRLIPPQWNINLRNHRKILSVDSRLAFAGGLNIGGRHMVARPETKKPVADTQCRFLGPIAEDLERLFLEDWCFAARRPESYVAVGDGDPGEDATGFDALCRMIPDGPGQDMNRLRMVYAGVVAAAERSVDIISPYFLPPEDIRSAMISAALRGVSVTVILPEVTNLVYVHAAMRRMIGELIDNGVRVVLQPAPFAHTKLLVVDGHYIQVGSANVDPRSLRLNFEVAVEVVDPTLSTAVIAYIDDIKTRSREYTRAEIDSRSFVGRLIDGFFWLFSPYL